MIQYEYPFSGTKQLYAKNKAAVGERDIHCLVAQSILLIFYQFLMQRMDIPYPRSKSYQLTLLLKFKKRDLLPETVLLQ